MCPLPLGDCPQRHQTNFRRYHVRIFTVYAGGDERDKLALLVNDSGCIDVQSIGTKSKLALDAMLRDKVNYRWRAETAFGLFNGHASVNPGLDHDVVNCCHVITS